MPSPLDRLIDAAVRCVKCNKPRADCRCYVTLECPCCGRRQPFTERHVTDPPNAVKVVFPCDKCPQEAALVDYFDAEDRQIDCDGNLMRQTRRQA